MLNRRRRRSPSKLLGLPGFEWRCDGNLHFIPDRDLSKDIEVTENLGHLVAAPRRRRRVSEEEKQGEEECARQRLQFLNEIHRAYFLLKNHGLGCLRSGRGAIVDSTIAITITIGPCPPEMTPATQNVERCLRTMEGATENAL